LHTDINVLRTGLDELLGLKRLASTRRDTNCRKVQSRSYESTRAGKFASHQTHPGTRNHGSVETELESLLGVFDHAVASEANLNERVLDVRS